MARHQAAQDERQDADAEEARRASRPTVCPDCGVGFADGCWRWAAEPVLDEVRWQVCPACQRIRDHAPAGMLTLRGPFFEQHREEIMGLVSGEVHALKAKDPMERIMDVDSRGEETLVTFTDAQLPGDVGRAVQNAYDGECEVEEADEAGIVRARWVR